MNGENSQAGELDHSGFGIASFIIAIVQAAIYLGIIAGAMIIGDMCLPEKTQDILFVSAVLLVLGGLFINLVGAGLGIAGVCQHHRKKAFAVLGIVLNFCLFVVVLGSSIVTLALCPESCEQRCCPPQRLGPPGIALELEHKQPQSAPVKVEPGRDVD